MKRVWILGAGFSRSLGGPLIQDLLAWRTDGILRSILPSLYKELAAESLRVRGFCTYGISEGFWAHAEEFLAMVETAALDEQSYPYKLLRGMLKGTAVWPRSIIKANIIRNVPSSLPPYGESPGPLHEFNSIDELLKAARRAVIADCWTFLQGAHSELPPSSISERWEPYVNWASLLDEGDTIITFNYDDVPDYLIGDGKRNKLKVIRPTKVAEYRQNPQGIVPVIKMHGATSWTLTKDNLPDTGSRTLGAIPLCLTDTNIEPLIGLPGPLKLSHSKDHFAELWKLALEAIEETSTLVFIGYRFPPTDFYAQSELLNAIARNNTFKELEIVLGAPSDISRRMENLFVNKAPRVLPLMSVDYLLKFTHAERLRLDAAARIAGLLATESVRS